MIGSYINNSTLLATSTAIVLTVFLIATNNQVISTLAYTLYSSGLIIFTLWRRNNEN